MVSRWKGIPSLLAKLVFACYSWRVVNVRPCSCESSSMGLNTRRGVSSSTRQPFAARNGRCGTMANDAGDMAYPIGYVNSST